MDNNVSSTILSEHRRVVNSRYILAILNFLAIIAGTLVTMMFVAKRGAPTSITIHLYILLAINVIQIALCITDYVLKQFMGVYVKYLHIISYSVAGLWLLVLISEMVFGTIEFGILRIDLIGVAVIQLVVALIAYLVWPYMDRRAIDAMIRRSVRDDADKRKKKSKGAVVTYFFLSLVIVAAQVGSLLVYKIPPRLYDLFAESRALKYEMDESGEGYVVTSMYSGTSTYVNVPAEYNNKPVIGIASGALVDDGVIDQHKITRLTFGTEMKNAEGKIENVCNLQYIAADAIVVDKVESLDIPASVVSIGEKAIKSASLKKLYYQSAADFDIGYLDCSSLEKITMEGEDVGQIRSLEGMSHDTKIEVAQDIYNQYREANFEYVNSFRPILHETERCLDFFTDCGYYIDSIFFKAGEEVNLSASMLARKDENGNYDTGITLATDTRAYVNNKRETGTNGAKANSAFRGWYFDSAFTSECVFTEDGTVRIADTTSLYAKWIDEYHGNLDWGVYSDIAQTPVNEFYWTDEDPVTFPEIKDRVGYSGGVQWYTVDTNEQVANSQKLSRDVDLKSVWLLDKPEIDVAHTFIGDGKTGDDNNIKYTYDEDYKLSLIAENLHPLQTTEYKGKSSQYTYKWEKLGDSSFNSEASTIDLTKVAETGKYRLTVTLSCAYGEKSESVTEVDVVINRKPIDMGDVVFSEYKATYTGKLQSVAFTGTFGSLNIKATYTYLDQNGKEYVGGVTNAGNYTAKVLFEKNNAEEWANYQTKTLETTVTINPIALQFVGWQLNGEDTSVNTVTYNGNERTYTMLVDGVLAGETATLRYYDEGSRTNVATNAGKYSAEVVGVENSNYTLDDIAAANLQHEWEIAKRNVTVQKWQLNGSDWSGTNFDYTGNTNTVVAIAGNLASVDENKVSFIYSQDPNHTNVGTDANTYTTTIVGVDNDNYYFDTESAAATKTWTINRRALTVNFATGNLTYNAGKQGITATIGNFIEADVKKFGSAELAMPLFSFTDGTGANNVEVAFKGASESAKTLTFSFTATTAGEYLAKIAKLTEGENTLYKNYSLTAATQEFVIQKAKLTISKPSTVYTYTGVEQYMSLNLTGFQAKADRDLFALKYLDTDITVGEKTATDSLAYNLIVRGTNALTYDFSVTAGLNPEIDDTITQNYVLERGLTDSFVIKPATVTVTSWSWKNNANTYADETKLVYNGKEYTAVAAFRGALKEDIVTLKYTNEKYTNVSGTYQTSVQLDDTAVNKNYVLANENKTVSWKIEPKAVDFTWELNNTAALTTVVYSAQENVVKPVYAGGLIGDDVITPSYNPEQLRATNVGSYTAVITGVGNANYKVGNGATFRWSITPKKVTVDWTGASEYTYNGQYRGPSFSLNGIFQEDVDAAQWKISAQTQIGANSVVNKIFDLDAANTYNFTAQSWAINVGTYKIQSFNVVDENSVNNENYVVELSAPYAFIINPKVVEFSGVWTYENALLTTDEYTRDTNLIYNKNGYTLSTTLKDGVLVDNAATGTKDTVQLGYSDNNVQIAGTYKAYVSSIRSENNNYVLPDKQESLTWTINPKLLVLEWNVTEKTYTANQQRQDATILYNATDANDGKAYAGDQITLSYEKVTGTDAGDYQTVVSATLANKNYYLTAEDSNLTCAWNILPAQVQMSWTASSFIYNGKLQYPTPSFWHNGQQVTFTNIEIDYNESAIRAGRYTVTPTKINDKNYILKEGVNHTFTYDITPKQLGLEWKVDGVLGTYSFTYNAQERNLVPHATGAVGDHVVELTYGATAFKNAGKHTVTVEKITNPEDQNNYTLQGVTLYKEVSVAKKALSFYFDYEEIGKDSYVYDGKQHWLKVTPSGMEGDEQVKVVYELDGSRKTSTTSELINIKDYGNKTLKVVSIDPTETNYSVTAVSKTISVTKRALSLNWTGDGTLTYDNKTHSMSVTLGNFAEGENLNDVNATFTTTGASSVPVGNTYTITAKDVSSNKVTVAINNNNYSISNTYKTLTINQKTITFTWSGNATPVYNGNAHTITAVPQGVEDGDDVSVEYTVTYNGGAFTGNNCINVGTYTYAVSKISNEQNYKFTASAAKATLTIKPQKVTIVWGAQDTFTYNGVGQGPSMPSVKGETDKNEVAATLSGASTARTIGTYSTNVTLSNPNYTIEGVANVSKTYTIQPKPVDLTWSNTNFVYSDAVQRRVTATVDSSDICFGDSVTVSAYNGAIVENYGASAINANAATNAGKYQITATTLNNTNYVISGSTTKTVVLQIAKQNVKVEWGNTSFEFNGNDQQPVVSVLGAEDGYVLTNDITYSCNTAATVNVGNYKANITALKNSNYTISEGVEGSLTADYAIAPQKVAISWNTIVKTYNGNAITPDVSVTGETYGMSVAYKFVMQNASGQTVYSTINAGTYTYTVELMDNNYTLDGANGATASSFTINPEKVQYVAWSIMLDDVYEKTGKEISVTVKGLNNTMLNAQFTLTNVDTNATQTCRFGYSLQAYDVGKYSCELVAVDNANYTLEGVSNAKYSFEIKPATVSVAWSDQTSYEYSGRDYINSLYVNVPGLTKNTDYTVEVTKGGAVVQNAVDAGVYTYTVTLTNSNYVFADNAQTVNTLTITPKAVTIVWGCGDYTQYGGEPVKIDTTVGNQVSGDNVNVIEYVVYGKTYETFYVSEPGRYEIKATKLDNANYTLVGGTNVTHVFEMEKGIIVLNFNVSNNTCTIGATHVLEGMTVVVELQNKDGEVLETIELSNGQTHTFAPDAEGSYKVVATTLKGDKAAYYGLPSDHERSFEVTSENI